MSESVDRELLSKFDLGDMQLRYYLETEKRRVVMAVIPVHMEHEIKEYKFSRGDSMVQYKVLGDAYPASYVGGVTMHNSGSTAEHVAYERQEVNREDAGKTEVCTYFRDGRGYEICHIIRWQQGDEYFECLVEFRNESDDDVTLDNLTSI